VAANLNAQGHYAEAQPLCGKALAISLRVLGEGHFNTALSYHTVAVNLNAQGHYAKAEVRWTWAADTFEIARLRSHDAGLGRTSFAARFSPFPPLAACLARTGKPGEGWRRLEDGLARGLLDELAARRGLSLPEGERQRQQDLVAQLAQLDKHILPLVSATTQTEADRAQLQGLLKQREAAGAELTRLLVARSTQEIFPLDRIQHQLSADAALLARTARPSSASCTPSVWHPWNAIWPPPEASLRSGIWWCCRRGGWRGFPWRP
jgi:hypothetical protein